MIKARTKAFANKLIEDPSKSQTEAYLETHKTESRATARARSSHLMSKPEVQIYMEQEIIKAKSTMVGLMKSDKEEMQFKASEHIIAYAHGKPLTKSTNLNLNVTVEEALQSLI